ncbi:MAG: hypothetical protein CMN27_13775 [Salinisphaera sp.]|nr:hypothetical protein [Salinisphaera sp.]
MRLRAHQSERPDAELYLMVDPTLGDPFADEPTMASLRRYVLPINHPDIELGKKPYLCPIQDPIRQERAINRSVELAVEEMQKTTAPFRRSICAWLLADTRSPAELAQCLARGSVKTDRHRQRHILRFWDPRVLPLLAGHERGHRLVPPVTAVDWLALDSKGELQSVPYPDDVAAVPVIHLTSSDEALLQDISLENAAACAVVERDQPWPGRGELASHIIRARELSLIDQADIAAFVADRKSQGVPIELADRIAAVLAAVRDDGASYQKLVAAWDEDDWTAIAAEALQRTQQHHTSKRLEGTQP